MMGREVARVWEGRSRGREKNTIKIYCMKKANEILPHKRLSNVLPLIPFYLVYSPGLGVDFILVKVVHQSILIAWQCFIPSMHVNGLGDFIIHTGVAISTLDNGSFSFRNQPSV